MTVATLQFMNREMWASQKMLGLDFESTGVDVEIDRVVTASLVIVEPGAEPVTHSWLVDPGVDIPTEASDLHGVTTEKAQAEGRPPAECLAELGALLDEHWIGGGPPLVIYNAPYDLSLYAHERLRHGLSPLVMNSHRVVDPLVIDRAVDRFRKGGRKLGTVCEHYGVPLGEDAHTSDADTLATLRLVYKIAARYPNEVGLVDLDTLHATQAKWSRGWGNRMSGWLRGEATKMENAWKRKWMGFIAEKFAALDITDPISDESVARVVAETRARAEDFALSSAHWPLRVPAGDGLPVGGASVPE